MIPRTPQTRTFSPRPSPEDQVTYRLSRSTVSANNSRLRSQTATISTFEENCGQDHARVACTSHPPDRILSLTLSSQTSNSRTLLRPALAAVPGTRIRERRCKTPRRCGPPTRQGVSRGKPWPTLLHG